MARTFATMGRKVRRPFRPHAGASPRGGSLMATTAARSGRGEAAASSLSKWILYLLCLAVFALHIPGLSTAALLLCTAGAALDLQRARGLTASSAWGCVL